MTCTRCGENAITPTQRFCQACGARLAPEPPVLTPALTSANIVGDGGDRGLGELIMLNAMHWVATHKAEIALLAVPAVVVLAAVVAVVIAAVAVVATIAFHALPFILIFGFFAYASRGHGPRRPRHHHHSRHRHIRMY